MKDLNGDELNVGDNVVFIATNSKSYVLKKGIVNRFEKRLELCV